MLSVGRDEGLAAAVLGDQDMLAIAIQRITVTIRAILIKSPSYHKLTKLFYRAILLIYLKPRR